MNAESRLLPAALSLACALAVGACAHGPGATAQVPDPVADGAVDAAGADEGLVPGLRRPRPGLLSGGQPGPEAWSELAAQGVTTVINLRTAEEMDGRDAAAEVEAAGMTYHGLPISGVGDLDAENAAALWRLVEAAPGPVLVHCASGNRVGALLALGAAQEGGMPPEQALEFGRSAGLASPRLEPQVRERLGLPPQE